MTRALPLPALPPFAAWGIRRFIRPVLEAGFGIALSALLYVVLVLAAWEIAK